MQHIELFLSVGSHALIICSCFSAPLGSNYLHAEWSYLSTFFKMIAVVFVYTVLCPESSDNALSPDPSFTSKAAILAELGYLASDTAFMSTQLQLMIPVKISCKYLYFAL